MKSSLLTKLGVTRLLLVPTLLNAMLITQKSGDAPLPPSLAVVVLMGEAPSRPLCQEACGALPSVSPPKPLPRKYIRPN